MRQTKIVCTVGPSTDQPDVLTNMIRAGMNVARFNFSHGSHSDHAKRISAVCNAAQEVQKPLGLMLDTKGPEMRIGKFKDGKVKLSMGQRFTLTAKDILGTSERVSVSYKNLPQEVEPGVRILLADGLIGLKVEKILGDDVLTIVQNEGEISNNKRVAVPGVAINLPPVSEQDIEDIRFGIAQGMDYIAASFIQRASDVLAIRQILEDSGGKMWIIAKIESPVGVENIDEILNVADGIMVARGDLGVEIPAEDVPLVQKALIRKCNEVGKPVITATQMLESMIKNPRPTRAEASDIANAILDGTDAIMLSGETASGNFPVEAVETMARIAVRTEQELGYGNLLDQKGINRRSITTDAVSHATVQLAHELEASAIITATESGFTARMISKYRPQAPIVAVTSSEQIVRFTQLLWGVYPVKGKKSSNSDEIVENSIDAARTAQAIQEGDLVVVTAGVPTGISGTTNMIRVQLVAKVLLQGKGIGQHVFHGKVCLVKSNEDLIKKFKAGDIMVIQGIDDQAAIYATRAGAILAEEGGLSSNAAIIGINYKLPVIVNAFGALGTLQDGMIITIDTTRGLVYEGGINAR